MKIKNKYVYNSKLSEAKFRDLIKYFVLEYDACKISALIKVSRNTVNKYLQKIRERIATLSDENSFLFEILELEQKKISYDKDEKKVETSLNKNNIKEIIQEKFRKDRKYILNNILNKVKDYLIRPDESKAKVSYVTNNIINRNKNNYIVNDLKKIRMRIASFKGITQKTLYLHVKECEFKYSHRKENLYLILLEIFRKEPLNLS